MSVKATIFEPSKGEVLYSAYKEALKISAEREENVILKFNDKFYHVDYEYILSRIEQTVSSEIII